MGNSPSLCSCAHGQGLRRQRLRAFIYLQHHGQAGEGKTASTPGEERQESPSQKALEVARPFGFPITNSIVVSWIVAIGLIVFAQFATRNMKVVPDGAQNFWEWMVEGLYSFLEGIIGPHLGRLLITFEEGVKWDCCDTHSSLPGLGAGASELASVSPMAAVRAVFRNSRRLAIE